MFCFEFLKSMPGISFISIPFSSEISKRQMGTGIRVDLEIREGCISSPSSCCGGKDGSVLPFLIIQLWPVLLSFPMFILVALFVHGNAVIYELFSFDPFNWIDQPSPVSLTKQNKLFLVCWPHKAKCRPSQACCKWPCEACSYVWSQLLSHCFANLIIRGPSHKVFVLFFFQKFQFTYSHMVNNSLKEKGDGTRDKTQ